MEKLKEVLEWMKTNNQIADCEAVGYKCAEYASFPISYTEYLDLWTEVLRAAGVENPYEDQGWTKDDPDLEFGRFGDESDSWIQEARYFLEYEGTKFIVVWLNGQGYAHQIILEEQNDMPFDESKKIKLPSGLAAKDHI
jgi:hypothetical protein